MQFSAAGGYVEMTSSGPATPDLVKQMYQQAAQLAKIHGVQKILVNVRHIHLTYDVDALYAVVDYLANIMGDFKIARLINLDEFKQDLIEDLAKEKRLHLRNFEHRDDAVNWLNTATD